MELNGQIAVITGGASGLGAATARLFAELGARVAILDRNSDLGEDTAAEIDGLFVSCDVGSRDAVDTALDHTVETLGAARVVVCCAGIGSGKRMIGRSEAHDAEVWDRVIRVNLTGTFNVLRRAAWDMRSLEPLGDDAERGVLITTSSIAAFDGVDGGLAYSASKAGVAGMTLPMARDLSGHGIRAVAIAPGSFETPLVQGMPAKFSDQLAEETPFPRRFGIASEFANLAEHIVTNTMLNGTVIRLDGGLRMRASDSSRQRRD